MRHLEPRPLKEFTCVLILARHLPQRKPSEKEIPMDVKLAPIAHAGKLASGGLCWPF